MFLSGILDRQLALHKERATFMRETQTGVFSVGVIKVQKRPLSLYTFSRVRYKVLSPTC